MQSYHAFATYVFTTFGVGVVVDDFAVRIFRSLHAFMAGIGLPCLYTQITMGVTKEQKPRIMTISPLYPCGEPCSTGTHDEMAKKLGNVISS